jgi:hypothetical protein
MKSLFDLETVAEIVYRINLLNENSKPEWGKMNVSQMIKHCSLWDEMALGKMKYKQTFLGKVFGRMALKDMLKDKPIEKNLPTVPSFKIQNDFNINIERNKWINLLNEYSNFSNENFIHPFFGSLTKDQTGYIAYKHIDHHLRQFNC